MTHSLHRRGIVESLQEDFVILLMSSKEINREGSGPKFRRFLEMALDFGANNIGDAGMGNAAYQGGVEKVLENVCDRSVVVHAVFKDAETVTKFLKAVKDAEFGLSVIVSGLFEGVQEICKAIGTESHTVDQSLGLWGKTDRLPSDDILEINTMCGHGMVSENLIRQAVDDVREGKTTAEACAERISRPCLCGIFNKHRAVQLLKSMAEA